jgi:glycerol-3-phosphate dehydrogenase
MIHDLLIIGGGINGSAIARAAAVAGRSILLVEQGDLAQATSSASTKLMHGGLRYLERYEFKLVHESLTERGIMLKAAPHLVRPLEFRIARGQGGRSLPILRLGLWLYDLLALRGGLPRSRTIRIDDPALRNPHGLGLSYWDAWVDDARLVVGNALDAAELGATIMTRTRFLRAERGAKSWTISLDTPSGPRQVSAAMIVNAAGPWVERVLHEGFAAHAPIANTSRSRLRLVQGSHLIVRRCFAGDHAWLFQQPDGRIVFAIPYQQEWTLIGTTDMPVESPEDAHIGAEETAYLLDAVNRYRRVPLTVVDIVSRYAGIRALYDDGTASAAAVSRDYHLDLDRAGPPLLNVFGGKITTARHLADDVLARLGIATGGTHHRPLPGGDFADFAALLETYRGRWPFLDEATLDRMASAYGTRLPLVMGDAHAGADMGQDFGAGLTAREVDYLIAHEWARSAEDILWRRTKLGLRLSVAQAEAVQAYVAEKGV